MASTNRGLRTIPSGDRGRARRETVPPSNTAASVRLVPVCVDGFPSLAAVAFRPPLALASPAVGVGQVFAAPVSVGLPRANVPLARPLSAAHGVSHIAASSRFRLPFENRSRASDSFGIDAPLCGSPFLAIGVGQRVATVVRLGPPSLFSPSPLPFVPSLAVGVGQFLAIVNRLGVPALGLSNSPPTPLIPFCELPYSLAVGVGQQEKSVSTVGRADI